MANETILVVDNDEKIQKVLEVSLKKAGYRVILAETPAQARDAMGQDPLDLIISETAFANGEDGFEFLADLKTGQSKNVPFIFLTDDRALPQKMKGFELGADDYISKPFYLKEITTRADLLIQRRANIVLDDSEGVEEIDGLLKDVTMIDLLQAIEAEVRSGTIHITNEHKDAMIYFREGDILDAFCGKLQGEDAIYRLLMWANGSFVIRYNQQIKRADRIEKNSGELLIEGIKRLEKFNTVAHQLPPLHNVYDADFDSIGRAVNDMPAQVERVLRLFDGRRSLRDIVDQSPFDDLTTLNVLQRFIADEFIFRVSGREQKDTKSNLEAWLTGPSTLGEEMTTPKFGQSLAAFVHDDKPANRKTERLLEAQDRKKRITGEFDSSRPVTDQNRAAVDVSLREIEINETLRREEEARRLSGQFAAVPSADTSDSIEEAIENALDAALDADVEGWLTEPKGPGVAEEPDNDRITDWDLEDNSTKSADDTGELFAVRERKDTPIRSQAQVSIGDASSFVDEDPLTVEASIDEIAAIVNESNDIVDTAFDLHESSEFPAIADAVSSEDAFDDEDADSIEAPRADFADTDEVPSTERPTADLKPIVMDPEPSDSIDLELGLEEETPPPVEIDGLPTVPRTAVDNQMVSTEYDLSKQDPFNDEPQTARIGKKLESSSDETASKAEKPKPGDDSESAFFNSASSISEVSEADAFPDYTTEEPNESWKLVAVFVGLVAVIAAIFVFASKEEPKPIPKEIAKVEAKVDPVKEKVEEKIEVPEEPVIDLLAAEVESEGNAKVLASNVDTASTSLAVLYAGDDIVPPDEVEKTEDPKDLVAEKVEPAEKIEKIEKVEPEKVEKIEPVEKVEKVEPEKVEDQPGKVDVKKDLAKAKKLIKRNKSAQARDLLREITKKAPSNGQAAYLLGRALFDTRANSDAISQFVKAERLGYKPASLYLNLAAAYQLDGNRGKAKSAYQKFLTLRPEGREADEVRAILKANF